MKWLFNIIMFLLLALPVRYAIERIKPFKNSDRNPQWVIDLRAINNQKIENGVLLNYARPIEAMFYTNLTAYSHIPDQETIADLIKQGYTVIIYDDGQLPAEVKLIPRVQVSRLSGGEK